MFTATFLALIPKLDNLVFLDDYRPIFFVDSLYRILLKLLLERLKVVFGKLISPSRSTFICIRNMLDEVLVLNEVMDFARRNKMSYLLLKVDFEKAYDCVSWIFPRFMLGRMGFCFK
ncbi:unnamed protein product [Vicia faba]|uniref:Reverse transcriptase domain-containing protein n=1 Tax=Vicia faba TaxID=3906 RepID=A0AAV0ZCY5_VICFA|nr:unnamed protein product [Vicia faba]